MQKNRIGVSDETKKMIAGMLANNLILNQSGEITPRFIDIYREWSRDERWHFQDQYFQRYFWDTCLIVPLWNANEVKDFAQVVFKPHQALILDRTSDTLQELIALEEDMDLKVRWLRMLLLDPNNRAFFAQAVWDKRTTVRNIFCQRLLSDILEKQKPRWRCILDWWIDIW